MANELREYEIELRKEGETKARKKIARKMKSLNILKRIYCGTGRTGYKNNRKDKSK